MSIPLDQVWRRQIAPDVKQQVLNLLGQVAANRLTLKNSMGVKHDNLS